MGDHPEGIDRDAMLTQVRAERARLEAVLARVPADRLTEMGVEGDWSVKDLMAHIAAWETQMVRWIETALRGDTPADLALSDEQIDAMNTGFYVGSRDRPLGQVRAEFTASYLRALDLISTVSEDDLFDPDRFPWRQGRPLWYMVGGNTFWHYREHREAIAAWLQSVGVDSDRTTEEADD